MLNERDLGSDQRLASIWLSKVKTSILITNIARFFFYFSLTSLLLEMIRITFTSDLSWIITLIMLPMVSTFFASIYIDINKVKHQIKKGKYKNITNSQPIELIRCINGLSEKMDIPIESLVVWANAKSSIISPTVFRSKGKNHIIFPLGFFKLLKQDDKLCAAIIAHELSHIRQRDADLFLMVKAIIAGMRQILLPVSLVFLVGMILLSINEITTLNHVGIMGALGFGAYTPEEASIRVDQIEASNMSDIFLFLFNCLIILMWRTIIWRSEITADLGALVYCSPEDINRAITMNIYKSEKDHFFKILQLHPSAEYRINRLNRFDLQEKPV